MSTLATTPPQQDASTPFSARNPWIYKPWIDLTVGCGAWSAPLLLLASYATSTYSRGWTVAFYFLALLFNYPHFMATVYRAYHTHTEFEKYRIFTLHIAVLLALAGVIAHVWFPLLPWIFTLYICWSPWHYSGQNFGLLMMFARRSGLAPSPAERTAIHLSFIASFLLLMLSFHTGSSGDPLILSLTLPARFTLPARGVLALFFVAATGWALISQARRSSLRAILAPLTLALTQFLWFLLPALVELFSGHEVPQTRYSSGILAVLHSTQYLWITSYYQKREARAAGDTRWKFSRYLVTLIAGGIALFIPGPWIVSRVFHADFAASFLTFTALVNIHHFILDGALWKLRDSRVAALLLEGQQKTPGADTEKQNSIAFAARWLTGRAPAARALRIATAALAAMQRASALNPANLALQESYGRSLIEAGRDSDAYALFQKIIARWPRNADALVDYGMLAHRLGHDEEAVDNWQRAVDVDPTQPNAQLYLAQALDQQAELQAAARHYRSYLGIIASRHQKNPADTGPVLAALIKVADADAAINHDVDASRGYRAAAGFADKAGEKTLESLALAHLADLQEKQADIRGAAESYQQALELDAALSDRRSTASDWFNYAQFLRKQKQPERYVFACLLHAENTLESTPGEELRVVSEARKESEVRLGKESLAVRSKLDGIVRESLSLQVSAPPAKK